MPSLYVAITMEPFYGNQFEYNKPLPGWHTIVLRIHSSFMNILHNLERIAVTNVAPHVMHHIESDQCANCRKVTLMGGFECSVGI